MSISTPAIIDLFQNASSSARQDFLTALTQNFYPSDWNHLHALLCNHSYYVDFLTLLPPEISLQVIQYLPREQAITLRRVSRRWHSLLTNPETCRTLAHHFFPGRADTHSDPVIHFDNLISRRLSFMRVDPSSTEEFPVGGGPVSFHADTSTFAFVTSDKQIQVCHLSDPSALILPQRYMKDRSKIVSITLSASIAAAISDMGYCQVWDLSTHSTYSFKIPSSRFSRIHSDGNTICIAFPNELVIHNTSINKTRNFPISRPERISSVIVHETNNRVWTVKRYNTTLTITSWSLDTGDIIGTPEEFTMEDIDGSGAKYAGNGIWLIQSFEIKTPSMTIEVSQICIDVAHTQTVSFRNYSVALPHVSPWQEYSPELSELKLSGYVYTWDDVSWINVVNILGQRRDPRVLWEHNSLQVRVGYSGGLWRVLGDRNTVEIAYNGSFIITEYWEDRVLKRVLMRFDGIHERQLAKDAD